jgi:hypothetical protein
MPPGERDTRLQLGEAQSFSIPDRGDMGLHDPPEFVCAWLRALQNRRPNRVISVTAASSAFRPKETHDTTPSGARNCVSAGRCAHDSHAGAGGFSMPLAHQGFTGWVDKEIAQA